MENLGASLRAGNETGRQSESGNRPISGASSSAQQAPIISKNVILKPPDNAAGGIGSTGTAIGAGDDGGNDSSNNSNLIQIPPPKADTPVLIYNNSANGQKASAGSQQGKPRPGPYSADTVKLTPRKVAVEARIVWEGPDLTSTPRSLALSFKGGADERAERWRAAFIKHEPKIQWQRDGARRVAFFGDKPSGWKRLVYRYGGSEKPAQPFPEAWKPLVNEVIHCITSVKPMILTAGRPTVLINWYGQDVNLKMHYDDEELWTRDQNIISLAIGGAAHFRIGEQGSEVKTVVEPGQLIWLRGRDIRHGVTKPMVDQDRISFTIRWLNEGLEGSSPFFSTPSRGRDSSPSERLSLPRLALANSSSSSSSSQTAVTGPKLTSPEPIWIAPDRGEEVTDGAKRLAAEGCAVGWFERQAAVGPAVLLNLTNCKMTENSEVKGFSAAVFKRFPESNPYKAELKRSPGSIFGTQVQTRGRKDFDAFIINLMAMDKQGWPRHPETLEARKEWLGQCLDQVGEWLLKNTPRGATIVVNKGMGAGYAGGLWENSLVLLRELADKLDSRFLVLIADLHGSDPKIGPPAEVSMKKSAAEKSGKGKEKGKGKGKNGKKGKK